MKLLFLTLFCAPTLALAANTPIQDDRVDFSLCSRDEAPQAMVGCLGEMRIAGEKVNVLVVLPAGRGTYDYYRVLKKKRGAGEGEFTLTVQSYAPGYPAMDYTTTQLDLTIPTDGSAQTLEGPAPYGYKISLALIPTDL